MSDLVYLKMASCLAQLSKCVSLQVGCLLVNNGRVVSTGVNGTPSGYVNCNEADYDVHHDWSRRYEIHAELNAVIWAARTGVAVDQSTAYVTHSPCEQCTKNLIASGVKRIVYAQVYARNDQADLSEFCSDNQVLIEHVPLDLNF